MTATAINLPLYRVLRALQVSEPDAEAAAAATPPDLAHLATKDELRAEIASVRADLKAEAASVRTDIASVRADLKAEIASVRADFRVEAGHLRTDIAQTAQRQTTWLITVVIAAVGIVIAAQRLIPPALPTDAVRAIVEQTIRNSQPQPAPAPAIPPRATPQP